MRSGVGGKSGANAKESGKRKGPGEEEVGRTVEDIDGLESNDEVEHSVVLIDARGSEILDGSSGDVEQGLQGEEKTGERSAKRARIEGEIIERTDPEELNAFQIPNAVPISS